MSENRLTLSQNDFDLLTDVSQVALQHIKNALNKLLKDEIVIKQWLFEKEEISQELLTFSLGQQRNISVINTDIVGSLEAKTLLLLSEEDKDKVCDTLLPDSVLGQQEMREGAVLEFDNIIIAAMVTKFSNLIGIKDFHGHVPSYTSLNHEQVKEIVENFTSPFSFLVQIKSFQKEITFHLLVIFNETLLQALTSFSKSDSFVGKQESEESSKSSSNIFKKLFQM